MESKNDKKLTYLQNRKSLTDLENELMVTREGMVREFGRSWTHSAVFKMDNEQGPFV